MDSQMQMENSASIGKNYHIIESLQFKYLLFKGQLYCVFLLFHHTNYTLEFIWLVVILWDTLPYGLVFRIKMTMVAYINMIKVYSTVV